MSIRTDLIEAKIAGKLQSATTEKLAEQIKSFQDYSLFTSVVDEVQKTAAFDPSSIKNLLLASTLIGGTAMLGARHMRIKSAHGDVLKRLLDDATYPDKQKVQQIYEMISQFAPRVSANYTFAKSVMDQLYNAPMISAPMIKEIVGVETGAQDANSIIPNAKDIMTSAAGIAKASV